MTLKYSLVHVLTWGAIQPRRQNMYHIYWNYILLETIFLKKIEQLHCIIFVTRIIVKNDRVVFSLSPSLLGINWRSLRSATPAFALASPGFFLGWSLLEVLGGCRLAPLFQDLVCWFHLMPLRRAATCMAPYLLVTSSGNLKNNATSDLKRML